MIAKIRNIRKNDSAREENPPTVRFSEINSFEPTL